MIGERPGLATATSLSAYMAFRPTRGQSDADRNLISNIHARGVGAEEAVQRILELAVRMMNIAKERMRPNRGFAEDGMTAEKPLAKQVALVTGAAKRIGRSVALRLGKEGADVIINYVTSKAEAEELASEIQSLGRRAIALQADVSRRADVHACSPR